MDIPRAYLLERINDAQERESRYRDCYVLAVRLLEYVMAKTANIEGQLSRMSMQNQRRPVLEEELTDMQDLMTVGGQYFLQMREKLERMSDLSDQLRLQLATMEVTA